MCPDGYAPDVPGGPCKTQCQAVANFLPGDGPPEYESTEGLRDAWMHRGCDCTCHTGPPWVAAPPWLAGGLVSRPASQAANRPPTHPLTKADLARTEQERKQEHTPHNE